MDYIWVGLGGFVGANARFMVVNWMMRQAPSAFPLGTLLVNLSGSFLIGVIFTMLADHLLANTYWRLLLVVGFLGGYTTFSSLTYESVALMTRGDWPRALAYLIGSNVLGMLACALGIAVVRVSNS